MKRSWLIVLAVILVLIIIEIETKKIPNPYKVLGISQNAND